MPISDLLISLALAILMVGLAFGIEVENILKYLRKPYTLLYGVLCQLILPVGLVLLLVNVLELDGAIAMGLLLTAAVPGGVTSGLITKWAKADLGLSLALTSITSVIVPLFTLPWLYFWGIENLLRINNGGEINRVEILVQLLFLTIVPVIIGLVLKYFLSKERQLKVQKFFDFYNVFYYAVVVVAGLVILIGQKGVLSSNLLPLIAISCGIIIALAFTVYIASRILRLTKFVSVTLAIETSFQNNSLALAIILTTLDNPVVALPPMVYGFSMTILGLLGALYVRRYFAD